MPQTLFSNRRLLALASFAISGAALCVASPSLHAETPLCTLTFGEPVQSATLDDLARGCLNRATAEYRSHPGAHIALTGPIAARVSAARQYLIANDSVPSSAVLVSISPGNLHIVQVTLVLAPPPRMGGGASVGAILGGIFGGGKGAAIGAATGAGRDQVQSQPIPKDRNYPGQSQAPAVVTPAPPPPALPVPRVPIAAPAPGPRPFPAPAVGPVASAPSGSVTQSATLHHAKPADPYADGEQVQDWEKRLKSGGIDFNNPRIMVVGKATGIVVVIHGYLDQSHSDLPGVVGQGTLKVSDVMRVDLDAPLAPGEFQITPAQGANQSIPLSGSATWEFQVTPTNETSDPQTLVIHPYLIPPGKYGAQPLQERNFTVQVTVESFWHHIHDLWKDDPMKVLKYFLPGGQGWSGIGAFFTGLIALLTSLGIIAWIKRKIDARGNPGKGPSDPSQ